MTRPTVDGHTNTEENYMQEELEKVYAGCNADKEKALTEQARHLQEKFEGEMSAQEQKFVSQIKQLHESHEQEIEYRSSTMRDSLQLANEVCYDHG